MMPSSSEQEQCVLVLMPGARDAERSIQLLSDAHLKSRLCASVSELSQELSRGAGAILVSEEILWADQNAEIDRALQAQEPWSMIPVLLIAREDARGSVHRSALHRYPGITLLEKPVRAQTLIGAVQSALRGRANQFQVRDLLRERERQSLELAAQDEKLRAALDTLSRQAEQLRSRDKLKDQFLATLAHELRNPLAPITAGLSVLESSRDPEQCEHTRSVMRRQVSHMVRLIDDLLDVSRITTGKLELKVERFAIRTAIDAAVEAAMPSLGRGRQSLKVDVADEALCLVGDQMRVAQIVSNLLNNASKYTPHGGHVELSVQRRGSEIVISVRDDGVGIPADRLEEVFEMFTQVDQPADRSQGGLGIGLALVRRLVEMHGGRVEAKSAGRDRGSTFTVHLPVDESRSAPDEHAARPPLSAAGGARRVLIVDDNEDARELLAMMLQQSGYETSTAEDGPVALEAARETNPQIVILDIGLPGMSGYEVAANLRQMPALSRTAIIALSGWGSPEDKRRAFEAGFDLHLTKPVFAEELHRALEALHSGEAPRPRAV